MSGTSTTHLAAWRAAGGRADGVVAPIGLYSLFEKPGNALPIYMAMLTEIGVCDLSDFGGALHLESLQYLGRCACQTLDDLHRASICHMDIKPQNLILMPTGTAAIIDFGLSKIGLRGSRLGGAFGTRGFKSPEQRMGKQHGPKSDSYSLGMVLWFLWSGVWPREEALDVPLEVPHHLRHLIIRLTVADPGERLDVAEALQTPFLAEAPRAPTRQLQELALQRAFDASSSSSSRSTSSTPASSASSSAAVPSRPRWADDSEMLCLESN